MKNTLAIGAAILALNGGVQAADISVNDVEEKARARIAELCKDPAIVKYMKNPEEICELSTDDALTWKEWSAIGGGLSLAALIAAGALFRFRSKKLNSENSKDDIDIPLEKSWTAGVEQDTQVKDRLRKALLESQMKLLKDNFQKFQDGKSDEKSRETFHGQAKRVINSPEHSDENKNKVRSMGRAIDPNNQIYQDREDSSTRIEPTFDIKTTENIPLFHVDGDQDQDLDIPNTSNDTLIDLSIQEVGEVLSEMNSISTKRDYSVGQKLITPEDKMQFISTSLQGDCIRIRKHGTIEKLIDGRWEHKNGAKIVYFATDDILRANSMTTSKINFVIDTLANGVPKDIESSLSVAPIDLPVDASPEEYSGVIKNEDVVTSEILAFVASSETISFKDLHNRFGGTQKGIKKLIQELVDTDMITKEGNVYIVSKK